MVICPSRLSIGMSKAQNGVQYKNLQTAVAGCWTGSGIVIPSQYCVNTVDFSQSPD